MNRFFLRFLQQQQEYQQQQNQQQRKPQYVDLPFERAKLKYLSANEKRFIVDSDEFYSSFLTKEKIPKEDFTGLTRLTFISIENTEMNEIGCIKELPLIELNLSNNKIESIELEEMTTLTKLKINRNPIEEIVSLPVSLKHLEINTIKMSSVVPFFDTLKSLTNLTQLTLPELFPHRKSSDDYVNQLQDQLEYFEGIAWREQQITNEIQRFTSELEQITDQFGGIDEITNPLISYFIMSHPSLKIFNGQPINEYDFLRKRHQMYQQTTPIEFIESNRIGKKYHLFDETIQTPWQWRKIEGIENPRQIDFSPITGELCVGSTTGEVYIVNEDQSLPIKSVQLPPRKNIYGIGI